MERCSFAMSLLSGFSVCKQFRISSLFWSLQSIPGAFDDDALRGLIHLRPASTTLLTGSHLLRPPPAMFATRLFGVLNMILEVQRSLNMETEKYTMRR